MPGYTAAVLADAPSGYWHLGEANGNFADSSGNAQTGIAHGSIIYGTQTQLGSAITLDGLTAYVEVADSADLDFGDVLTLECWLRPGSLTFPASVIDKGVGAYQLTLLTDLTFRLQIRDGDIIRVSTTAIPNDGVAHHVVATKNGSSAYLYLDGEDVSSTVDNTAFVNTADPLRIGATTGGAAANRYNGVIDEVAVYDHALSAGRVLAHFLAVSQVLPETVASWSNLLRDWKDVLELDAVRTIAPWRR